VPDVLSEGAKAQNARIYRAFRQGEPASRSAEGPLGRRRRPDPL